MNPETEPIQRPGVPQPPTSNPESSRAQYNTLAIISFVLAFMVPIAPIVLGVVSLKQISKTQEKGRGLAIAGTLVSILFILITIVAIIFLPQLKKNAYKDTEARALTSQYLSELINQDYAGAYALSTKEVIINKDLSSFITYQPVRLHSGCDFEITDSSLGKWSTPDINSKINGVRANTISSKVTCPENTYNLETSVVHVNGQIKIARLQLK